jgi:hypothetical protein
VKEAWLKGWFYAVQIQVDLTGDTDPNRWKPEQYSSTEGTATALGPNGAKAKVDPNSESHNDSPKLAISTIPGYIDWLDAPGQGKFLDKQSLWTLFEADVTISFVSSAIHVSGEKCSVEWSLKYKMKDGVMDTPTFKKLR